MKYNNRLNLSPHSTLSRGYYYQGERHMNTWATLYWFHLCLFLVSKKDIRSVNSQKGNDIGSSSMPTGEMPALLLMWGTSLLARECFPHRKLQSVSCDLWPFRFTEWVFPALYNVHILSSTWRRLSSSLLSSKPFSAITSLFCILWS